VLGPPGPAVVCRGRAPAACGLGGEACAVAAVPRPAQHAGPRAQGTQRGEAPPTRQTLLKPQGSLHSNHQG